MWYSLHQWETNVNYNLVLDRSGAIYTTIKEPIDTNC